jgi:hypothetical protein
MSSLTFAGSNGFFAVFLFALFFPVFLAAVLLFAFFFLIAQHSDIYDFAPYDFVPRNRRRAF